MSFRRLAFFTSQKRCTHVASASKPRRSMLYVPGSSPRMLEKSVNVKADALCFDLEDSVAAGVKIQAREGVLRALENPAIKAEKLVRINSVGTRWSDGDLESVLASKHLQGIVIPKVHSAKEVQHVTNIIEKLRGNSSNLKVVASIESAQAIINLSSIATSSPLVDALLFAAEDYCADTGILRSSNRSPMLYARSAIVTHARAYGLQAIDLVCVNYKDANLLEEECVEGKAMGFDGKQAIHPTQVDLINKSFSPTEQELSRAVQILKLNKIAEESGRGAFGLEGMGEGGRAEMIDAPLLLQAARVVEKARMAGMHVDL